MELLLIAVFALHLLCANVAGAGPLVSLWHEWREARGDEFSGKAGRYLAGLAIFGLLVGGLLGVLVGYLLYAGGYAPYYGDVFKKLASRIHFGVWELLFSLVLMIIHLLWWRAKPVAGKLQRGLRMTLPFLAATNLLYHFPLLMAMFPRLGLNQHFQEFGLDEAGQVRKVTREEFYQLLGDSHVLSQSLHFILASFAVCGVVLLGYSLRAAKENRVDDVRRLTSFGGRLTLIPSLLQIPVGLWVLTQLSSDSQQRLMGGEPIGTGLFLVSMFTALWLMHESASVSRGNATRGGIIRTMIAMLVTVFLMTGTLLQSREAPGAANRNASSRTSTPPCVVKEYEHLIEMSCKIEQSDDIACQIEFPCAQPWEI